MLSRIRGREESADAERRFASTKWRGAMIAAVFATQALGQFLATVVALIVTECFRNATDTPGNQCQGDRCDQTASGRDAVDRMWRIIIGFGAIPAVIALYCRLTIPETPRYTFDVNRDVEQGFADYKAWVKDTIGPTRGQGHVDADREDVRTQLNNEPDRGLSQSDVPPSSWKDFKSHFGQWQNFCVLLGTAGSWFFLDAAYYALALNNTIFLQKLGYGSFGDNGSYSIYTVLQNGAIGNLILVCAGAIPGSVFSFLLVDVIGRKPIQIGGFAMLTVLLLILGSCFEYMTDASRVAIFVLCLFFFNFGKSTQWLSTLSQTDSR
jgi:PHS family inorganic phosphate transporter-like MFS transporter